MSFAALLLFCLALFPLIQNIIGWSYVRMENDLGLQSALRYDKNNAIYHYMLGRYYHRNLGRPDLPNAIEAYRDSIRLNPLQPFAWSDLSRAYLTTGQAGEAEYALERAVKLSPNDPDLLWEAGTFWLMNNMTDKAFQALRRYLVLMPDKQAVVYDLCWKLKVENRSIIETIVPSTYQHQAGYLAYLIATKRINETQEAWKSLDQNRLEKKDFIAYSNFLIDNGMYESAEAAWNEITQKIEGQNGRDGNTLIWNPGFEDEPLNGGFDWRISGTAGVNIFIDEAVRMTGSRSLGVAFDGLHNPDVTIAQQIVKATPGQRYSLKGYIKASGITTKNGVFFQVIGHKCSGLDVRSESVTGDSFWKEIAVDFDLPQACSALIVKIRRERSQKLDNKIEGTAWIDGITLKPQTTSLTNSSRKHST